MGVCNPNIPYANFWFITNNPTEHTMPNTPRNRVYCNCRFLGFITIHIAHTFKKQLVELLCKYISVGQDSQKHKYICYPNQKSNYSRSYIIYSVKSHIIFKSFLIKIYTFFMLIKPPCYCSDH